MSFGEDGKRQSLPFLSPAVHRLKCANILSGGFLMFMSCRAEFFSESSSFQSKSGDVMILGSRGDALVAYNIFSSWRYTQVCWAVVSGKYCTVLCFSSFVKYYLFSYQF